MQKKYSDIPIRIVGNQFHYFIEMQLKGQWKQYCLSGYNPGAYLSNNLSNAMKWLFLRPPASDRKKSPDDNNPIVTPVVWNK
jgi:hypothetical protein